MRSSRRDSASHHHKDRNSPVKIQLTRKPRFSSPAAQEALHELAHCLARAVVDAMIADLETWQLPEPRVSNPLSVVQDVEGPRKTLPETGFLRLRDIIGDRRRGIIGLIPVSTSTWYAWIAARRAPIPVKIGQTSVWRVEDIRDLIQRFCADNPISSPRLLFGSLDAVVEVHRQPSTLRRHSWYTA